MKKGAIFTEEHKKKLSEIRRTRIKDGLIIPPKGMLGKHHSLDARKKISLNHKSKDLETNRKFSEKMKGHKSWTIPWTLDRKQRFKETMIKKFNLQGRKTKSERTTLCGRQEYKEWRSNVFQRDNWTCQTCQDRGVYLEAHHIKSWAKFPDLRYEISNGVALCKPCHKLTDNYAGKSKGKNK